MHTAPELHGVAPLNDSLVAYGELPQSVEVTLGLALGALGTTLVVR